MKIMIKNVVELARLSIRSAVGGGLSCKLHRTVDPARNKKVSKEVKAGGIVRNSQLYTWQQHGSTSYDND